MTAPLYPSEDLRKRLEELGVPRDKHNLAELGEMLPEHIYDFKFMRDGSICWGCIDKECMNVHDLDKGYSECDETEANARAKMLIYLKEKGLLK